MSPRQIELRGVEVHNLKKIDLDLPHRQLICICGVSGSGKTSLALDTLYAEGQRRYIESFSAYTRQFLEKLEKPQAERISGLPPAIAVDRRTSSSSNRSTIGTATEISDYLRLLFARVGAAYCQACQRPVPRLTAPAIAEALRSFPPATQLMVGFEFQPDEGQDSFAALAELRRTGLRTGDRGGCGLQPRRSAPHAGHRSPTVADRRRSFDDRHGGPPRAGIGRTKFVGGERCLLRTGEPSGDDGVPPTIIRGNNSPAR